MKVLLSFRRTLALAVAVWALAVAGYFLLFAKISFESITISSNQGEPPVTTRSSGQIAWLSEAESPHGNYDLFVVDLATLEERRLTTTGFSQGLPSWSDSGQELVYVVSAMDNVGQYDLYIMNADGTDSHSITPSYFPAQFLCHWATFSADDAVVYFIGEWWD